MTQSFKVKREDGMFLTVDVGAIDVEMHWSYRTDDAWPYERAQMLACEYGGNPVPTESNGTATEEK